MVEVHRLAKRFGAVEALRDVCFKTRKGTITALLGENGAGKTTTLRILLGFLRPDSGAVAVAPGRIGYVPDRPAYFPGLDGWEILRLAGPEAGRTRPGERPGLRGVGAGRGQRACSSIRPCSAAVPRLVFGRERQEVRLPPEPPRRARPPRRRRALCGARPALGQVRPGGLLRAAGRREDRAAELPHAGRDGEDRRRLRRPPPGRDDRPRRAQGVAAPALGPDRARTSSPCSSA